MSLSVGIWQIGETAPQRLSRANIDLEQHLEDWIERDPSLVQPGLTIVGRQMETAAGWLDLLVVDPLGRWSVIEIKRGLVRRETVAQALDYAACIVAMPAHELEHKVNEYLSSKAATWARAWGAEHGDAEVPARADDHDTAGVAPQTLADILRTAPGLADAGDAEREVSAIVVGTGRDPHLERMVAFLARKGVAISVVLFGVYRLDSGQQLLIRELTDGDEAVVGAQPDYTIDAVLARADALGIGKAFRTLYEHLTAAGLHALPRKVAIRFTPPGFRSRCLMTIDTRADKNGHMFVYVNPGAVEESLGIPAQQVEQTLGTGWFGLPVPEAARYATAAERLFRTAIHGEEELDAGQTPGAGT